MTYTEESQRNNLHIYRIYSRASASSQNDIHSEAILFNTHTHTNNLLKQTMSGDTIQSFVSDANVVVLSFMEKNINQNMLRVLFICILGWLGWLRFFSGISAIQWHNDSEYIQYPVIDS